MRQALEIAARGRGYVEPNPMVGCVIVRGRRIVGRAYHRRFGRAHAEVNALRQAGPSARGASAYVTLEPCGHVGKTPPCADALIDAGIRRVVVAMKDPNALVAGRGLRRLRSAGIDVGVGLLRREAAELNAPFVVFHRDRRPYVTLKWAQSIDGKIATRTGDSRWITSRAARVAAHGLRARVDAILVGVGTVLADDPGLTARWVAPKRTACRIVLDTRLRIPVNSRLVRTARETPTLVAVARGAGNHRKRRVLESAGCRIVETRRTRSGIHLPSLLGQLHGMDLTHVMVEGGGRVLGSFLAAGLADAAEVYVAPRIIGGEAAPGPLRHRGPADMQRLPGVRVVDITRHGPDLCYHLRFR